MVTVEMDYSQEAPHSNRLVVRGHEPFNAEPLASTLVEFAYTPDELIYCRNHGPVEELDEDNYIVTVDGLVSNQVEFSIKNLQTKFDHVTVVAALQCAGNRRKEMATIKPVKGINWDNGVIANCRWRGVRLRDVLSRAGVEHLLDAPEGTFHVWFASHVTPCQDDSYYGGSIPLSKAMDPEGDVILALDMNDQPLSPDRGYPLRVVVPGYTGARWVKWIDRITIATGESPNFYQKLDYKVLPPHVETAEEAAVYWPKLPSIQSLPVNSIIASIAPHAGSEDEIRVKGYAMGAGGTGGRIGGVQVSVDGGENWDNARITYQEGKWSWTLWECVVDVKEAKAAAESAKGGKKELKVLSRARDEKGELQIQNCEWNYRGVSYNSYGQRLWRW